MSAKQAKIKKAKIADLRFDERNANLGTARGDHMLEESLQHYGAGRSVLIDKHGRLIAGNKTAAKFGEIGGEEVIIVPTNGRQLVAVQREDLDLEKDDAARLLAYADNRTSEVDLEWDVDQIKSDADAGVDLSGFFTDDELSKLLSNGFDETAGEDETGLLEHEFAVFVRCSDENEQRALLERLTEEGYECRALMS